MEKIEVIKSWPRGPQVGSYLFLFKSNSINKYFFIDSRGHHVYLSNEEINNTEYFRKTQLKEKYFVTQDAHETIHNVFCIDTGTSEEDLLKRRGTIKIRSKGFDTQEEALNFARDYIKTTKPLLSEKEFHNLVDKFKNENPRIFGIYPSMLIVQIQRKFDDLKSKL